MQIFIEVLKLIFVSLLPGAIGLGIYIADRKISYIKNLNKYVKGVIIGLIFACTAMLNFYFGMSYLNIYKFEYKMQGCFGPVIISPIIASMIFGWLPGLVTGVVGGIWRFFAVDLAVRDYLRFPNSLIILLSALIGILLSKIILKKNPNKTPKWTYGIVIGLIMECIHLLIAFPIIMIRYNDIDTAHEIINQVDWALFLCSTISLSLAFLWLNIYNKQKIRIFTKESKLHSSIQKRLTLAFVIGLVITFTTSSIFSLVKSYGDAKSDLTVAAEDVVNEINDSRDMTTYVSGTVLQEIVLNRRIRTNGFIMIVSASDQIVENPFNDEIKKDQIIGTPVRFQDARSEYFYFNNNPNDTCEKYLTSTITFKDNKGSDITCPTSSLLKATIYDYSKNKKFDILTTIIKMEIKEKPNSFYVCSILTLDEATDSVVLSIRISLYFEILVYAIVYLLIYRLIRKKVVDNIDSVNDSLQKISAGKLETKVNVMDYEEFTSLSNDINHTVDVLKQYIEDANKRIDDELKYAKNIQINSLPLVFPTHKNFDLFANMITAKQVGGDFYDCFMLDEKHLFFMVADVSGKGIPAAMFMMKSKAIVNSLARTKELSLDQIINKVNLELNLDNNTGMFVTAWFAILDVDNGEINFVNAGHTRPVIKNKDGCKLLNMKSNTVLGVFKGYTYSSETYKLQPGDSIIAYTDGVTEATNKSKKLYGEDRLLKFLNNTKARNSTTLINNLEKDLMKFQKNVEQSDDITILTLTYKPNKNKKK